MLFITETVKSEDLNNINEFFNEYENSVETVEEHKVDTCVSKYITSLVSGKYQQSVEDIAKTTASNKVVRKKTLQQVMQESFFYGANRFGNNFIA